MDYLSFFSKELLKELGILDFGYTEISKASSFNQFKKWIDQGHQANLKYLENDKMTQREDIKNYFPEFQSAFVFLFDYRAEKKMLEKHYQTKESNNFKIGSYTLIDQGSDYHFSIREKLEKLSAVLKEYSPEIQFRFSLDTQPILERDLAYRAGLGWFGKNSMLIHQKYGSFFLIGAILCDQKFKASIKIIDSDHCGTCLACVDACPTAAINPIDRSVETQKCVPYFTIEVFKDIEIPPQGYAEMQEVFGCDICQDVCPWNKKSLGQLNDENKPTKTDLFNFFLEQDKMEMEESLKKMSKKEYKRKFKNTSFERVGRDGFLKNLKYKK